MAIIITSIKMANFLLMVPLNHIIVYILQTQKENYYPGGKKTYYLDPSEKQHYYNRTATIDGKTYLFGSYAELLRNGTQYGYASDENGIVRTGFYRTDKGYLCYLDPRVISYYQPLWKEIDGKLYHFEKATSLGKELYGSPITTNATLEKDGKTYVIDENGVATEKVN